MKSNFLVLWKLNEGLQSVLTADLYPARSQRVDAAEGRAEPPRKGCPQEDVNKQIIGQPSSLAESLRWRLGTVCVGLNQLSSALSSGLEVLTINSEWGLPDPFNFAENSGGLARVAVSFGARCKRVNPVLMAGARF